MSPSPAQKQPRYELPLDGHDFARIEKTTQEMGFRVDSHRRRLEAIEIDSASSFLSRFL
jgi:hypothetical protein